MIKLDRHIDLINKLKSDGKGLMSTEQYMKVGQTIELFSPCNLLIFGLGEDASVWEEINSDGRTVFLEDDAEWMKRFDASKHEIYEVEYNTKVEQHKEIGFDKQKLKMNLPEEVENTSWDIIFVDGPLGHNPPRPYNGPGRMQSIYEAYRLLKQDGICIIDDMGRLVERTYANHFFGKQNMFDLVQDKVGIFKKLINE